MEMVRSVSFVALAASLLGATPAFAQQFQISAYGGYQGASHSLVTTTDGDSFYAGWEGLSFTTPIYYGVRGTWWLDGLGLPGAGLSIDFSHTKVYADSITRATSGYSVLEFTDGLNLLTVNGLYKFFPDNAFHPYVGVGGGISLPHVEVTRTSGTTFESQLGGPTVQVQAGVEYQFLDNWSVFAEYKGNYSWVDVAIDSGARLRTNLVTHALNAGVSVHF